MANSAAKHGKQTGTKNTKAIGAVFKKARKTVNPWGPILPNRRIGKVNGIGQSITSRVGRVRGSATRKPTPDASLRSMDYPRNDPLAWPVEIDTTTHVRQPSQSGITSSVIANVNASIEQAYTRDKYQ
jgi:hypothetical protein